MSLYVKNIGSRKFRVMLRNGTIEELESLGLRQGREMFLLDGKTPLECFDRHHPGSNIIFKGHKRNADRSEVLLQACPVCGKKPGIYK